MTQTYPPELKWLLKIPKKERAAHFLRSTIIKELLDHHAVLMKSKPEGPPPSQARKVLRVIGSLTSTDPEFFYKKMKEIEGLSAKEKFNALRNFNEAVLNDARFAPFDVPHHPDPVRLFTSILQNQAPEVAYRATKIVQLLDPNALRGEAGLHRSGSMHTYAHIGNLGTSKKFKDYLGKDFWSFASKFEGPKFSAHPWGTGLGEGALPGVDFTTPKSPALLAAQMQIIRDPLLKADELGKAVNRQRWTPDVLEMLAPDNPTLQRAILYPDLAKPGDLNLATEVLNRPQSLPAIKKGLLASLGTNTEEIQRMKAAIPSRSQVANQLNEVLRDWTSMNEIEAINKFNWGPEVDPEDIIGISNAIERGTGYHMMMIPGMGIDKQNFKRAARFIRRNWKGEALGIIADERVLEQVLKGNYKKAAEHGVHGMAAGGAIQAGLRHSPKVLTRLGVPAARAGMLQGAAKAVLPGLLPVQARELANVASKHYTGKDLEQHIDDTDAALHKSGVTSKPGVLQSSYMSSLYAGGSGPNTHLAADAFTNWLKELDIFGRASRAWNNR